MIDATMLENFKNRGRGFIPENEPPMAMSANKLGFAAAARESRLPQTEIFDQGSASSCLAQAFITAILSRSLVQGTVRSRPFSRLWLFLFGRSNPDLDTGMQFSAAVRVFEERGLPAEEHWPYDANKIFDPPPNAAIQHAVDQKGKVRTHALSGATDAIRALSSGCPIVVGFRNTFGGPHAVAGIGHRTLDNGTVEILFQNSWGEFFGENGCIWLNAALLDDPYEQIGLWSVDFAPSPSEDRNPL